MSFFKLWTNLTNSPCSVSGTLNFAKVAVRLLPEAPTASDRGSHRPTRAPVRAVAIEPGFFATEIYGDRRRASIDPASHYAAALAQADDRVATGIAKGADPAAVAHAIVAAVDDPTTPARVLVGEDAFASWDEFRRALIKQWQAELGN
jgi:NAD(P)-dependent dehydrogenase (short-subunit alcohol dehydrogenase family)